MRTEYGIMYKKGIIVYLDERQGASVETRVAVIAIIVKDPSAAVEVNALLHEYDRYIIGRMGVPYRAKGMNIISIAIDAPQDDINKLAGSIGRVDGVSAKTVNAPE